MEESGIKGGKKGGRGKGENIQFLLVFSDVIYYVWD